MKPSVWLVSLTTRVFVLALALLWEGSWSHLSLTKTNTPLTGLLFLLDLRDLGRCARGCALFKDYTFIVYPG